MNPLIRLHGAVNPITTSSIILNDIHFLSNVVNVGNHITGEVIPRSVREHFDGSHQVNT